MMDYLNFFRSRKKENKQRTDDKTMLYDILNNISVHVYRTFFFSICHKTYFQ